MVQTNLRQWSGALSLPEIPGFCFFTGFWGDPSRSGGSLVGDVGGVGRGHVAVRPLEAQAWGQIPMVQIPTLPLAGHAQCLASTPGLIHEFPVG